MSAFNTSVAIIYAYAFVRYSLFFSFFFLSTISTICCINGTLFPCSL